MFISNLLAHASKALWKKRTAASTFDQNISSRKTSFGKLCAWPLIRISQLRVRFGFVFVITFFVYYGIEKRLSQKNAKRRWKIPVLAPGQNWVNISFPKHPEGYPWQFEDKNRPKFYLLGYLKETRTKWAHLTGQRSCRGRSTHGSRMVLFARG